ncbi:DUF4185 domain-containing protein [Tomitella biformata]|uniref:DUF4185 domain-containing protein n=1 Tax=Tomitella biformata TaxID=630403 RepID=UPI00046747F9|nr:DUF4185 domain-containing protein [Tomitella biformata]
MRILRNAAATATAAATAAALLATSPLALADPVGCALSNTGVAGLGLGAAGGPNHPIPWLNGQSGLLPNLGGGTQAVEHITGLQSPNETIPRFNVAGTDLGIMWDNGLGGTLAAFGDTTGITSDPLCEGLVGDWRSNVLLRSTDTNLSDGMRFDSAPLDRPGRAREALPSLKVPGVEFTVIPTSGISAPTPSGVRQYMSFMSVRSWDEPGEWTTNYSAIGYSDDNGETWHAPTFDALTAARNRPATPGDADTMGSVRWRDTPGNEKFQMAAFTRSSDPADNFVYSFGTPSGRSGSARLSRVRPDAVLDVARYEYWDGGGWVAGDPTRAAVVIDGPVSELSVAWNAYLGKYIAMYSGVTIRTANSLTGPWTEPHTLVSSAEVPTLYGGFMHPVSNASGDRQLYFVGTTWSNYNVMLLRTDLAPFKD